jgi:2-keto-4-pentenoate hydratase/2-oxohepta-3-ene-1,7-dioic acid hydratase in catechol pathway
MKLVTFREEMGVGQHLGSVCGDELMDLTAGATALGLSIPETMIELIDAGGEGMAAVRAIAASERCPVVALSDVEFLAPIPRPGKIVGVGLNYVEHVGESARALDTATELPTRPVLFDKPSTAVVGHNGAIRHDGSLTEQLDWEAELGVVIGARAFRVSSHEALSYVFGYSIINDISARDQRRSGQWFFSKGQDSYAPFGPWIVTADELPDPTGLRIRLRVNGVTKQDSTTAYMLFNVAKLIVDITSGITLEPGDVIATGSPSGVGAGRTPPEFLKPGDTVEAEIDGVGVLRNHVIDARPAAA